MAWYYGTYSCGHEGRTNIIGPTKSRQWIADSRFAGLCPECYKQKIDEENRIANEKALKKANEMDLPALIGTGKQVAWANTIRQSLIDDFDYRFANSKNKAVLSETLDYWLETHVKASWYIDNRNFWNYKEMLEFYSKHITAENEELNVKDIKAEATVFPETSVTDIPAEIVVADDTVKVLFEKNDAFIKIVKGLGYKWSGAWEKEITETTGSAQERAAELGNKLLNAGFPIILYDEETRSNAINGTFKLECTRWIKYRKDEERLAINWGGKDDDLYNNSRKIKSSLWSSPSVTVKIEYYKEVADFAEMYGFKFTNAAQNAISEYKEKLASAIRVSPVSVKTEKQSDPLKDILNSSRDVLQDLRDD